MNNFCKRIMVMILVVSLSIACFAIPASAVDLDGIHANSPVLVYDIKVNGVVYNVVITLNNDGTSNVSVDGNGNTLSWTTKASEAEYEPLANIESHSYDSYRYTFCETAATPWHLYRPLQDDGSAATKGIGYAKSEFARRFADQIKNMLNAEALISQFLEIHELITSPVNSALLEAVGGIAGYYLLPTLRATAIAGAIGILLAKFGIPRSLEEVLSKLVEEQYNNICDYIDAANNYFELA